jgi:hypothetical protein
MIGASKILTVSYGTFSCTLEGFDEPFNTMKAIAEYFRDLAAEDRYFGAEPPTPDAAMLHRIAEREIQRRVEAKIQDNGVILRTGDAMAEPVLLAPLVQPALADAAVSADSVAARLSKLRGTAAPAAELTVQAYHEDQDADDLIANLTAALPPTDQAESAFESLIATAEEFAAPSEGAAAEADWQSDDLQQSGLSDFNLAADVAAAQQITNDDQPEDPDDQDALTAAANAGPLADFNLAADVAAAQQTTNDDQPEDPEDQDALTAAANAEPLGDFNLAADVAAAQQIANDDQPEDPDDQDALTAAADAESVAELERFDAQLIADTDQTATEELALDAQAAEDAMLASLGSLIDPDDQEYLDDDLDVETPDLAPEPTETEASFAAEMAALVAPPAPVAADEAAEEPAVPGRLQRARARVIKIRRVDAPAAAEPAPLAATGLLSPEAEAALQAELAALEAELAPPVAAAPANIDEDDLAAELSGLQPEPAIARTTRPARPVRAIAVTAPQPTETEDAVAPEPRKRIETDGADEAVSRLMAQTNTAMDGVDIKRRQSAIAHLKAAVVATEADRQVAPAQPKADRIDPYRHDLESVVRPLRVETAQADRPQPLVLVSEQRIDRSLKAPAPASAVDAPRVVAPVRPRRITSGGQAVALHADSLMGLQGEDLEDDAEFDAEATIAGNLFSDAESFGDFADRLGATELPDMLEAAAVYCAQVLGRPQFSRPMVLSQLATLPEAAEFSREDGLRVFGTLMRQGRIAKIKHGQFAVTERSPLLAEALRTAG